MSSVPGRVFQWLAGKTGWIGLLVGLLITITFAGIYLVVTAVLDRTGMNAMVPIPVCMICVRLLFVWFVYKILCIKSRSRAWLITTGMIYVAIASIPITFFLIPIMFVIPNLSSRESK